MNILNIVKLLDVLPGKKTYIIGGLMVLHGVSQAALELAHGKPVDQATFVEIGAGMAAITGRRAVNR